jgi:hypothetical protein
VKKTLAGCGDMTPTWMVAPVQQIAQYSPLLALARAWRVPFAPFVLNIAGTFSDPSVTVLPTVSLQGGQTRLTQLTVMDRMAFEIYQPSSFPGSIFKNQSDVAFKENSGIEATLNVNGAPRYAVAPFFTPIEALCDSVSNAPSWPMGWILGNTQSLEMQFQAAIPLPVLPTMVTVTFRMWQPVGTDEFVGMTNGQAFAELFKIYANDPDMIAGLTLAQTAPVGR